MKGEEEGVGFLWFTVYRLLLIGWEKLRLNMMIGRFFFEKTKLKLKILGIFD